MKSAFERLIDILVGAPKSIGGILDDWDDLDGDAQEQYAVDTEWLLSSSHRQIVAHANDLGVGPLLVAAAKAATELAALGERMEHAMGFRPESLLPPEIIARLEPIAYGPICGAQSLRPSLVEGHAGSRLQLVAGGDVRSTPKFQAQTTIAGGNVYEESLLVICPDGTPWGSVERKTSWWVRDMRAASRVGALRRCAVKGASRRRP